MTHARRIAVIDVPEAAPAKQSLHDVCRALMRPVLLLPPQFLNGVCQTAVQKHQDGKWLR